MVGMFVCLCLASQKFFQAGVFGSRQKGLRFKLLIITIGIFAQLTCQNCSARESCSKNAIKMTIGVTEVALTYVLLQHSSL